MRVGTNPHKKRPELEPYKRHRIIVPIYIGANHEYFREASETLKLCFRTLFATIDLEQVSVTVINNDSIPEVDQVLAPYIESGQIDRYIQNSTNRGKPDAVAAEIKACYEPFVTLTDCDVLFRHGWMRRLEEVFLAHRGVGAVSPFPAPNHQFYKCGTTWLTGLLNFRLRSGKYVSEQEIDSFLSSIGKAPEHFPAQTKKMQFKLDSPACETLIGAGHFVVMFRTAAFQQFHYTPKLAGASNGEQDIDAEPDNLGYLRLSTPGYHVYHLGNALEDWMPGEVAKIEAESLQPLHSSTEFAPALNDKRPLVGRIPPRLRRAASSLIQLNAKFYRRHLGGRLGKQ